MPKPLYHSVLLTIMLYLDSAHPLLSAGSSGQSGAFAANGVPAPGVLWWLTGQHAGPPPVRSKQAGRFYLLQGKLLRLPETDCGTGEVTLMHTVNGKPAYLLNPVITHNTSGVLVTKSLYDMYSI